MGEIKSTLDLVMEKTKNLSLSDEEKRAQKQKETESRIKGLLQKYLDGLLAKNQLRIDYESLKKEFDLSDDASMIDEILRRLDPNQDNQLLLEILEECCRVNPAVISSIIDDFRRAYDEAAGERMTQLKEDLARKYAISGSAVVPNLDADEQWRRLEEHLRLRFEDLLNQAKGKLLVD
ncbi:MAG: hypothetical protein JSW26_00720 [Desulfobacterales bacterium]|nr:MAG: hypothetical protein JSW26_00720 [Desulfobacterales bacterium]